MELNGTAIAQIFNFVVLILFACLLVNLLIFLPQKILKEKQNVNEKLDRLIELHERHLDELSKLNENLSKRS